MPRLIDAHAGLVALQSAHTRLPSLWRTRPHTVSVLLRVDIRGVRTFIPSVVATPFCIVCTHRCISS